MKEIEVTLSIRNNRLKQRRLEIGMNQAEVARAVGITPSLYGEFEAMKISPLRSRSGDWRPSVLKLADFHGVSADELFPQSMMPLHERSKMAVAVNVSEIDRLIAASPSHGLLPSEVAVFKDEAGVALRKAVALLPPSQRDVIARRFGIGRDEQSLSEIAEARGLCRERIRQIEMRALAALQTPRALKSIREFDNDTTLSAMG